MIERILWVVVILLMTVAWSGTGRGMLYPDEAHFYINPSALSEKILNTIPEEYLSSFTVSPPMTRAQVEEFLLTLDSELIILGERYEHTLPELCPEGNSLSCPLRKVWSIGYVYYGNCSDLEEFFKADCSEPAELFIIPVEE